MEVMVLKASAFLLRCIPLHLPGSNQPKVLLANEGDCTVIMIDIHLKRMTR